MSNTTKRHKLSVKLDTSTTTTTTTQTLDRVQRMKQVNILIYELIFEKVASIFEQMKKKETHLPK